MASYASVEDLAAWLAPEEPPAHAARLLEAASDAIDEALIGAVYDTDDPEVQEALRGATVRQAHWMIARDDETGALDDVQSMSVGGRSIVRRTTGARAGASPTVAPRAASYLRTSGLLRMGVWVVG